MNKHGTIIEFPPVVAESVQLPKHGQVARDEDVAAWERTYIPSEHRAVVDDATQTIQTCMKTIVENIFEIGRQLRRVKDLLEHGAWRIWLKEEFGLEERKAQHLMNIDRRLGTQADLFRRLQPTALYHLSMPSTPETAIAVVAERIRAGRKLKVQEVIATIAAHKRPALHAEDHQATAARFTKSLRKACAALNNQTIRDCEDLLTEEAATRLDELRMELDLILDLVQRTLPNAVTSCTLEGNVVDRDLIVPGCTVSVREADTGQEACYTLVTNEPGNPEVGRIHWESPVAQALHNKQVGEVVTAHTPDGPTRFTVTAIRFPDGRLAESQEDAADKPSL